MKKNGILNSRLSKIIALIGNGECIVISNAGIDIAELVIFIKERRMRIDKRKMRFVQVCF